MSWAEDRRADRDQEFQHKLLLLKHQEESARRTGRDQEQKKKRDRDERRGRRAERIAKIADEGDTVAALIVMACALAPAFYFQVTALLAAGLPWSIALALATMLESGAWVATVAGERAKKHGRPVMVFRLAMWGCAVVAASINYSHAPQSDGGWLAWVLAGASVAPVGFWELRGLGRHAAKSSRTKAQRAEDKAKRRHQKKRRAMKPVWARYEEILAAHPFGTVKPEAAWAEAWSDVNAAPLGQDAKVLARRLSASAEIEKVLAAAERSPESIAIDAFLADLFPARGKGDDGEGGTPLRGPSGRPPKGDPEAATTLGRKGKQGSGRTSAKTPLKPLEEADLEKVRKFADALGDTSKLSARNVREVLGGGANEYVIRVRDAVKKEREDQ